MAGSLSLEDIGHTAAVGVADLHIVAEVAELRTAVAASRLVVGPGRTAAIRSLGTAAEVEDVVDILAEGRSRSMIHGCPVRGQGSCAADSLGCTVHGDSCHTGHLRRIHTDRSADIRRHHLEVGTWSLLDRY